jgi:Flp pilus assembly protein TadG
MKPRVYRTWRFLPSSRFPLLHRREGTAAAEFGIIAAIMVVCLISVFDLANMLQQHIRLREAVRAGGLFAQTYSTDSSGIVNAVTQAASGWSDINVSTPNRYCQCWNTSSNTYSNSTCDTDCSGGATLVGYVSITASRPFSPLFLPMPGNTTTTHVVRFQ